jgi:hypothetical protein
MDDTAKVGGMDEMFDEKRKLLCRANPMFMLWADN